MNSYFLIGFLVGYASMCVVGTFTGYWFAIKVLIPWLNRK